MQSIRRVIFAVAWWIARMADEPSIGNYSTSRPCVSVCVCFCVCLSVFTLEAEPSDLWTWNLVGRFAFNGAWMSSKVKVIGQGHKVKTCKILIFSLVSESEVKVRGQGSRDQGQMSNIQPSIRKWGQRSRSRGQGYRGKFVWAWLLLDAGSGRCVNVGAFSFHCMFTLAIVRPVNRKWFIKNKPKRNGMILNGPWQFRNNVVHMIRDKLEL